VAIIGISSQPLLKLAQGKLPNIEAAFEAVFQSKVKVSVQTKTAKSSSVASTTEVKSPKPAPEPMPQPAAVQASADRSPDPTVRQVPSESQDWAREKVVPLRRANLPFTASPENRTASSAAIIQNTPAAERATMETNAPRLTIAPNAVPNAIASQEVKSDTPFVEDTPASILLPEQEASLDFKVAEKALIDLKQFFEGEIVELTDRFELSESAIADQSPAEKTAYAAIDQLEPEIEEELDAIEPVISDWEPSTVIATSDFDDDDEDRLETQSWEDEEDIPF
jgi:DNA polymerase-3 subunit gamma/tau